MGNLSDAINEELSWNKTWNGADALATTGNFNLDLFGRAGSMRSSDDEDKRLLFSNAFNEDADIAVKLLFYIRDIRGGYGERNTFIKMLRHLATINTDSVVKNLWAILEFGRAKDLYGLIGTPAEEYMWEFMKNQFEMDYKNMLEGKSISLLAKWIATPDSASTNTKQLGKLTAKKLGYKYENMREYKTKLRKLRKYLDLPEAKMCAGAWDEIEYSKCASKFLLKNRKAIMRNDAERWNTYIQNVNSGKETMNMGTVVPCDIFQKLENGDYTKDLEVMWNNLPDLCNANALVMCDTSGSMCINYNNGIQPIVVAASLSTYFAQRNKGDLKDMFMTFDYHPEFVKLSAATLYDNYKLIKRASWGGSTNLEAAFNLLLDVAIGSKLKQEDMPEALIVVSDMQINMCMDGLHSQRITFYDYIANKYEEAGYKLPHVIFWNVNAMNATFHAASSTDGVSLVSGYSPNVFKQVMDNIGKTPYELMMDIVNSERYKDITA